MLHRRVVSFYLSGRKLRASTSHKEDEEEDEQICALLYFLESDSDIQKQTVCNNNKQKQHRHQSDSYGKRTTENLSENMYNLSIYHAPLSFEQKQKKARMYVCATSVIIGGKSPHFPKVTETCVMCMMTPVTAMPASHRTGTRASRGRWPPGGASAPGSEHREPRPSQCHRASLGCAATR